MFPPSKKFAGHYLAIVGAGVAGSLIAGWYGAALFGDFSYNAHLRANKGAILRGDKSFDG